jgi:hypothetical protein
MNAAGGGLRGGASRVGFTEIAILTSATTFDFLETFEMKCRAGNPAACGRKG